MEKLAPGDAQSIGSYRLLARLGSGGLGQVYLARAADGRTVALRLIRRELAAQPAFRAALGQEVAAARRVAGPWAVPLVDADTEAELPWTASEYIPGPTLLALVAGGAGGPGGGPLPPRSVRVLASGLAHALQDIHAAGVVHRDLKPSNVLITEQGPRLADFGVSRALDAATDGGRRLTGALTGAPGFMSPEQVRGEAATPAADVFSLGSVLTYAATGRLPFGATDSSAHALQLRITQEEPDTAGLPAALAVLVRDCLRKDPAERPAVGAVLGRVGEPETAGGPWLPGGVPAQDGPHTVRLAAAKPPTAEPQSAQAAQTAQMQAGSAAQAQAQAGQAQAPQAPQVPVQPQAPRAQALPQPTPQPQPPLPPQQAAAPVWPPLGPAAKIPPQPHQAETQALPPQAPQQPQPQQAQQPQQLPQPQPQQAAYGYPPPGYGYPPPYQQPQPYQQQLPQPASPPPHIQQAQQQAQQAQQPPAPGYGYPPFGAHAPEQGFVPGFSEGPEEFEDEPDARRRRGTIALIAVAVVVAIGAGGAVYGVLGGGPANPTTASGPAPRHSAGQGGAAPSPADPAPASPADPAPASSSPSASPKGDVPQEFVGTWSGGVRTKDGLSPRTLTIRQGRVGDTVLVLTADGATGGKGGKGGYHCEFTAPLAARPGDGGALAIGPSAVRVGQPATACTPGAATTLTITPDGGLRRVTANGEALTYTRR
ncbi:serine/threonine-protein kinase [Streptomyces sp. NPDC047002]|uniref:serine/threonine-protein kinase n=1 Tax=Streptomyces sp. NPDC047002 TaxID=3155475 RepID=UPI003452740D